MSRLRRLTRGARRRCANCGAGGLFSGWFTMVERCPTCGHNFAREDGYWLGAMMVNLAVTEGAFGAVLGLGLALTWPDPPWTLLLAVGLTVNATLPVAFYPFSKTVWVGLDLFFNPPGPAEEADAVAARSARGDGG